MKLPWLAPGTAPPSLQTAVLLCRPLKLSDVIRDYDAVMSSRTDIQFVFGPDVDWPTADLSIEQGTGGRFTRPTPCWCGLCSSRA